MKLVKRLWKPVISALSVLCSGLLAAFIPFIFQKSHQQIPSPAASGEDRMSELWNDYSSGNVKAKKIIVKECSRIGLEQMNRFAIGWKEEGDLTKNWKNYDLARAYFNCVLLADPRNREARLELGGLYYNFNRLESALRTWNSLAEIEPTDYHYWLCARICDEMRPYNANIVERMVEFCHKGLACCDSGRGFHDKLKALLASVQAVQGRPRRGVNEAS